MVTFTDQKLSNSWKENPGTGTLVVAVPFVPDYIQVEYLDNDHSATLATVHYILDYIGTPTEMYRLTVNWVIPSGKPRRLRYTVGKLSDFGGIG
jgi:hypothetical protein